MLEAVAGRPVLDVSYAAAADRGLPLARVRRRPPPPAVMLETRIGSRRCHATPRRSYCSAGASTLVERGAQQIDRFLLGAACRRGSRSATDRRRGRAAGDGRSRRRRPRTAGGRPAANGWRITGTSEPGTNASAARRSGRGQAQLGARVDRHRRPAVRPHREREVLPHRRAGVVPFAVDDVHVPAPVAEQRVVADRVGRRRRPAAPSDRPCVRCAGGTPNTSAIVACRSTFVVSASTRARVDSRPRDEQRRVPELRVDRDARVCRTRRARRGSGRGRCRDDRGVVPQLRGRRAGRGCGRASGRSSRASTGSWRGSAAPRRVAAGPSPSSRSSTAARSVSGPSHAVVVATSPTASGVSNGSCGSNSSTNNKKRS